MQKVKNNDMSAIDIAHIWNAGALMFLLCTSLFFCDQMMFGNKIFLVVPCLMEVKQQYLKIKIAYIYPIIGM
jgi:Tfp pilus assembly protein PilZ